jgi:uncharacterized protein
MALPMTLEIKTSSIHGTGVFAKTDLPAEMHVIEYVGEKISKPESVRRCALGNPFIFSVTEEFDLDGDVEWNPARLINHSCAPNCEAQCIEDRIWIVTMEPVPAGAELTFNYGYDLDDYEEHPCRCGSAQCPGYMVAAELAPVLFSRMDGSR